MVAPPFAGVTVKVPSLQMAGGVWFGITGVGFTVTVIVNGAPTHAPAAPEVGVTVYVAVCGTFVGLVNVWLING